MANRIVMRVAKTMAALALFAGAAVAILLFSLWLEHGRSTILPVPSGSYQVGRTTYVWKDDSRLDPYAPARNTKQELAVWIWYPAAPTASLKTADYLPAYWRNALVRHEGLILRTLLSRDLSRIQTHSWTDAEVSPAQPMFPIIILRAGGGALSTDYTSLAEDLASHGYVVVSFDAPYRTVITAFPDGRVAIRSAENNFENMPHAAATRFANQIIRVWIGDVRFVLDKLQGLNDGDPTGRFKGKLDMQKIGIAGHSLGGATAAQFCHDDMRCRAGIDIDGMPFGSVIQDGLHQPFFFIMSDHSRESGPETRDVENDIESIYNKVPEGERWQVTITGANHFSFSDQMLTKNSIFLAIVRRFGVLGSLDGRRGLAITSTCIRTFFDVYLKSFPNGELKNLPTLYPEVKSGILEAFPR